MMDPTNRMLTSETGEAESKARQMESEQRRMTRRQGGVWREVVEEVASVGRWLGYFLRLRSRESAASTTAADEDSAPHEAPGDGR